MMIKNVKKFNIFKSEKCRLRTCLKNIEPISLVLLRMVLPRTGLKGSL